MHSGDFGQPGCNQLLRFATRLQKCQKNPNLTRIWGGDSEEALTEVTQTSQMHNFGTSLYEPNTEMQFKAVLFITLEPSIDKAGIVGFFLSNKHSKFCHQDVSTGQVFVDGSGLNLTDVQPKYIKV